MLVSLLVTVGIPGVVKAKKTHLGLDLQGGIELIFQARPGSDTPVDSTSIAEHDQHHPLSASTRSA